MLKKRLLGMVTIIVGAMLVFSLIGCGNGTTNDKPVPLTPSEPQSVTYISEDSNGNIYTLVVTENTSRSARYAARNGDSFTFTVTLFNSGNYTVALTYSGTIDSVGGDGTAIELNITVNGEALNITIVGTEMTVISGTIVLGNNEEITITEPLTPATDRRALELVINAANAAKEGVVVSADGADVLPTVYWVSETRMDTFITAIANAQVAYDAEDSDQALLNSERNRLMAATTVFNGQKRLGTQSPYDATFTSVGALGTWLHNSAPNTPLTHYIIALNVNNITGLKETLDISANKYVSLDLSGSTFTSIEDWAFAFCETLTSVTIPNSVTSIGDNAFASCSNLTSINVDSGNVNYSSEQGVLYNKNKTTLIKYPARKTNTSFTIPNSVITIGGSTGGFFPFADGAFSYCTNLISVTLPTNASFTAIGDRTFEYCTSLASIIIPNSVTSIGRGAFYDCNALASVTIPNGVTSIGENAFGICTSLTGVTIPNSVTSIEGGAFMHTGLTSVTIPDSVTSIEHGVFVSCRNLASVTIPNGVTSIGGRAFANCSSLTSITIPNSVASIGEEAFDGCTSLVSVTFQGTITSSGLHAGAFGYLGSGNYIGDLRDKFYATDPVNGTPGTYTTTAPVSDSSVWTKSSAGGGTAAFTSVAALGTWLADQPVNTAGTAYTVALNVGDITGLKETLMSAGKYVYLDLSGSSITTIPEEAFHNSEYGCTVLTGITIGNSVISIGQSAFFNCSSLASVTIGNNVTSIGRYAFSYCDSLASIAIPNNVTSIGECAFGVCGINSITIPAGVTSIEDNPFYACTNLTSINVDSGNTAYSSQDGVLYNKGKTALVQYPAGKTVGSFTIPNSVTSIRRYAFSYCDSLISITIPNTVTGIEEGAFVGCTSLASVTIPTGVTSIERAVFANCSSLTGIAIPSGVTSIGIEAFSCTGLTSVTIPASVATIWDRAFDGCTSLASVTFQGTLSLEGFGFMGPFDGDLWDKYLEGGIGTYTTTAPVGRDSVWTRQ